MSAVLMRRATGIILVLIGLLAGGCEVKPVRPVRQAPPPEEGGAVAVAAPTDPTSEEGAGKQPSPGSVADTGGKAEVVADEAAPRPAAATGRLRTLTWDFGTLLPGVSASHRFSIANDDTRPWTVKRVVPSCACLVGEFASEVLKPAATSALEVTFRGLTKQGPLRQGILVEFREPGTPVFNLVVQGEVSDALSAVPAAVKFGRVGRAAHPSQSFEFHNNGARDVAVARVEAPDWLRVECRPETSPPRANGPRQKWEVVVRADPAKLKPGSWAGAVVIHADVSGLEPVRVPVSLHVNGSLEAIPGALSFDPVASGKGTRKTILLEVAPELGGLSERDFEVRHDLGGELDVRVVNKVSRTRFTVVGEFRPKRSPGRVKGEVEIRAKGRDVEPARVEVRGEVR